MTDVGCKVPDFGAYVHHRMGSVSHDKTLRVFRGCPVYAHLIQPEPNRIVLAACVQDKWICYEYSIVLCFIVIFYRAKRLCVVKNHYFLLFYDYMV